MKTVLVTGAAGFLGSHLMLHHLEAGDNVLGIDNFCSSSPTSKHVAAISGFKNGLLVRADITVEDDLLNACNRFMDAKLGRKFDLILNFACPASPPIYQSMPVETLMTCTLGTKNILDIARVCNSRVVHASTSEVYGDPTISPQAEAYRGSVNSYGPRSCYDEGKRAAEALCYDYLNKHKVDARLIRIFNTYGPNMHPDDGRVVSNFICQALQRKPLTVYGDGSQTRSLCYVDDLIKGIVLLSSLDENPKIPINLGNPHEFTMNELANEVIKLLDGHVKFEALPIDDPCQRRPDISLAKELLGWSPDVHLGEGLAKTIEHFKGIVA